MKKNIRSIFVSVVLAACLFPALAQAQNLFVNNGSAIYEIASNGVVTNTTALPGGSGGLGGLAFDKYGNMFAASYGNNAIYEVSTNGTVSLFTSGVGYPAGLAFDNAGNLFAASPETQLISEVTPTGAVSTFASLPGSFPEPYALAFDAYGNLFVAVWYAEYILEYQTNGTSTTFATGLDPFGLAFDREGNLYASALWAGQIYKFAPDGTRTVFASVQYPAGLAFDGAGNLYTGTYYGSGNVYKITPDGTTTIFANVPGSLIGLAFQPGSLNFQIVSQPQSQVGFLGMSVSLSVSATGGVPPLTYQWLLGGVAIANATNSLLVLTDLQATNAGVYTVVVTDAASNTLTSLPATLTVNPVLPIITWASPAPIPYGTALDTNQLNATASFAGTNVPGTFAYNPTNGTVLNVGTNTLSVLFTPTDSVDYSSVTDSVSLVVSPAPLTVTLATTADDRILSYYPDSPGDNYYFAVYDEPEQGNIQHALAVFDLSAIPAGQTILSATLELTYLSFSQPAGTDTEVYRLTSDWGAGQASWDNRFNGVPWNSPGGDYVGETGLPGVAPYAVNAVPGTGPQFDFDVTELVSQSVHWPIYKLRNAPARFCRQRHPLSRQRGW